MQIAYNGAKYNRLEVSKEQLQKIRDIADAFKGTRKYGRYMMFAEGKNTNGRWFDLSWSVPRVEEGSYLKVVKDNVYLMQKQGYVEDSARYTVTQEVMDLFGWEVE